MLFSTKFIRLQTKLYEKETNPLGSWMLFMSASIKKILGVWMRHIFLNISNSSWSIMAHCYQINSALCKSLVFTVTKCMKYNF